MSRQSKKYIRLAINIMTRNSIRRNLYAILLLMVMVLQVGIKTFHVHHDHASVHIECEDCDQHRVHDGHLTDWDGQSDDCMLCQLLSAQYVSTDFLSRCHRRAILPPDPTRPVICMSRTMAEYPATWTSFLSVILKVVIR